MKSSIPEWVFGAGMVLALSTGACATSPPPGSRDPLMPRASAVEEAAPPRNLDVLLARLDAGAWQEEPTIVAGLLRDPGYRSKYSGDCWTFETAPCEGNVLAANDGEGRYLISIGSKDGVREGIYLVAFRGSEVLGILVVDMVFNDRASAVVLKVQGKSMRKSEIRIHDGVISAL